MSWPYKKWHWCFQEPREKNDKNDIGSPPPNDENKDMNSLISDVAGLNITQEEDDSDKPAIRLEDLTPEFVQERTGFDDIAQLLSFATIVCGGNLDTMSHTHSMGRMTWLEERVLYFEVAYQHSTKTWHDYQVEYKVDDEDTLAKVFEEKLKLVLHTRNRWAPPTEEELERIGGGIWNERVGTCKRVPRASGHTNDNDTSNADAALNRAWSFQINFMNPTHLQELE